MKTNLDYLKEMSGDSSELIIELIDIFNEQVKEYSTNMQKFINNNDYDSLGKLAHKAKSSVSIMGMTDLTNKLKEIEIMTAKDSKHENYQEFVNFFRSECLEASKELLDYKSKINSTK